MRWSPVYYAVAVLMNCFLLAVAVAVTTPSPSGRTALDFLHFFYLSIYFGTLVALAYAWLLRRALSRYGASRWWQWPVAGAVISLLLVGSLGLLAKGLLAMPGPPMFKAVFSILTMLLLMGPLILAFSGYGLGIAVASGAATASVLFFIYRGSVRRSQDSTAPG